MRRLALTLTVLAALIAGCGSDSPEDAARGYLSALAEGDGAKACGYLTGDGKRDLIKGLMAALPRGGLLSCEEAIDKGADVLGDKEKAKLKKSAEDGKVEVHVSGNTGTVTVDDGSGVPVKKVDGAWRIDGGF